VTVSSSNNMPSRKRIQSKRGGIEVEDDVVSGVEIKGVEVDDEITLIVVDDAIGAPELVDETIGAFVDEEIIGLLVAEDAPGAFEVEITSGDPDVEERGPVVDDII